MFRTDDDIEELSNNAKAKYYYNLQTIYTGRQTALDVETETETLESLQQAGLYIGGLDTYVLSNADKNAIADALNQLKYGEDRNGNYVESSYWDESYSS